MTHWNLKSFYPSLKAWETERLSLEKKIAENPFAPFLKARTKKEFLNLLQTLFEYSRTLDKLYTYIHLVHDLDLSNPQNKTAFKQCIQLVQNFENLTAFISPLLVRQKTPLLKQLQAHKNYTQFITQLMRAKKHTLSDREELLLAKSQMVAQTPSSTFSILNNVELELGYAQDKRKKKHKITHASYQTYLKNNDQVLRKNAFQALHGAFKKFGNTFAELISGHVQTHLFYAQSKHFSNALEYALFSKKLDQSVYFNLIKSVHEGFASLHRFLEIKRKVLKLKQLNLYDVYLPLYSNSKKVPYPQGLEWVLKAIEPLGKEYHAILKNGLLKQGWVDVYEKKNKRSGAYSSGCFDSHPYMLLNYSDTLYDVFVLAHEAGHSMHSYFSNKTQPFENASYPIFLAEIASITNEELLFDHLFKNAKTKQEQIQLLSQRLDDIRATLFRQTMFAEFELWMHQESEKMPLTLQSLSERYLALNKEYFGKKVSVNQEIEIEWARIPHFYSNFYVFNYATSYCIANYFAGHILQKNQKVLQHYLTLLKSGGSQFPVDLLNTLGVDLNTPKVFQNAIKDFENKVDKLATLLKRA
jgi:oligoendopeptidase F